METKQQLRKKIERLERVVDKQQKYIKKTSEVVNLMDVIEFIESRISLLTTTIESLHHSVNKMQIERDTTVQLLKENNKLKLKRSKR